MIKLIPLVHGEGYSWSEVAARDGVQILPRHLTGVHRSPRFLVTGTQRIKYVKIAINIGTTFHIAVNIGATLDIAVNIGPRKQLAMKIGG